MKLLNIHLLLGVLAPSFIFADLLPAPNVVVFLADDMGLGDTSAFQEWTGNEDAVQVATPNMERLAHAGIRFTDAHAPSSRCSPSRYALMTGRYCWRTHLKHWVLFGVHCPPLIERERVTMPEFLQQAGYRTGIVGKWHLGVSYRNAAGAVAEGWQDADFTQAMAIGGIPVQGASTHKSGELTGSERLDFVYENDVLLGRVLDQLAETPDSRRSGKMLLDNTLVVFASDNGAESKEKTATGPIRSNKGSVNLVDSPEAAPALSFLLEQAKRAAGDDGRTL